MAKNSEDKLQACTSAATTITTEVQQGLETTSSRNPKYKGVRKRKWGKWVSEIRLPNSRERIWLGSYDSPEKAARAFDAAQFCLRGPAANFNFPENPPDIPGGRSMSPAEIQAAAAEFANAPFHDTRRRETVVEEEEEEEEYSPTISDGQTVQMESEVAGVEESFCNQTGLNGGFGSGNFASEFGMYTGFDEFTDGEYYSQQPGNFDYAASTGAGDHDNYDASIYQGSFLWNF